MITSHRRLWNVSLHPKMLGTFLKKRLELHAKQCAIRKARKLVAQYSLGRRDLVEELIAERRAEAKREML